MANSTVDMDVAPLSTNGEPARFVFEKDVSLSAAGNSDAIIVPPGVMMVAVTVNTASGATAKVQTSTDTVGNVKNSSGVIWVDWDAGAVTATTQDVASPVTALRLVQAGTGTTHLSVRAS